jgi:hypothetical protein
VPLGRPQGFGVETLLQVLWSGRSPSGDLGQSGGEGEQDNQQAGDHGTPPNRLDQPPGNDGLPSGADPLAPQPAFQVVRQRLRGPVAPARIFLQTLEAQRFQVAIDLLVESPRADRFLLAKLPKSLQV